MALVGGAAGGGPGGRACWGVGGRSWRHPVAPSPAWLSRPACRLRPKPAPETRTAAPCPPHAARGGGSWPDASHGHRTCNARSRARVAAGCPGARTRCSGPMCVANSLKGTPQAMHAGTARLWRAAEIVDRPACLTLAPSPRSSVHRVYVPLLQQHSLPKNPRMSQAPSVCWSGPRHAEQAGASRRVHKHLRAGLCARSKRAAGKAGGRRRGSGAIRVLR